MSLALHPEVSEGRAEGPEDTMITSTESGGFSLGDSGCSLGTFQRLHKNRVFTSEEQITFRLHKD